ncbi:MAG: plasmid recombination protein [Prolixibacteraceae bacterium]|nr:plasmid recombination protein [Prolixibacteraceae bacterium]
MSSFAVVHTTKLGSGAGGIGSHIDRTQKKLPKNVDQDRMHLNKEYVATGGSLIKDINRRIDEGYTAKNADGSLRSIRKDAVKAVGLILSGSHERMKELEKDGKLDSWARENLKFVEQMVGKENIVRFTMHRDEKTPHIHCVFVPLDKEGRLNAKQIVGNKSKLTKLQTEYGRAMEKFGLNRGVENSRMRHTTTREYYRDIEDAAKAIKIETNLVGVPRKGEEERLQEMYQVMAAEVFESKRRLQKELNIRPEWENKLIKQTEELSKRAEEIINTSREVEQMKNNQVEIISKNIREKVELEKQRLIERAQAEIGKIQKNYKDKESMLDEMVKTKHINRTLAIINSHIQENFKVDYKIVFNEKENKFLKEKIMPKKDRGLDIGGR